MDKLAPLEEVLGTVRRRGAPEGLTPVENGPEAGLHATLVPLNSYPQKIVAGHALTLAGSAL